MKNSDLGKLKEQYEQLTNKYCRQEQIKDFKIESLEKQLTQERGVKEKGTSNLQRQYDELAIMYHQQEAIIWERDTVEPVLKTTCIKRPPAYRDRLLVLPMHFSL